MQWSGIYDLYIYTYRRFTYDINLRGIWCGNGCGAIFPIHKKGALKYPKLHKAQSLDKYFMVKDKTNPNALCPSLST